MPHWTDFLDDQTSIEAIFRGALPSGDNLRLHEILLNRDGPVVSVRFDVPEFPSHPPEKWRDGRANRVQISLSGLAVSNLEIRGIATEMNVEISVEKIEESLLVELSGGSTSIRFRALALAVNRISAYLDSGDY